MGFVGGTGKPEGAAAGALGAAGRVVRVSKEFDFHACHQLPNHDGQCARQHGHTYRLVVVVSGKIAPADESPAEGMVVDFSVLKRVYRERIEPLVEHQDLNLTLADKVPVTTCEMMAVWILEEFAYGLHLAAAPCDLVSVRLYETPTSYAEVLR